MYYNFMRIHQTLKVTPAMAAGVTDKLWEMEDLVVMLEQWDWRTSLPSTSSLSVNMPSGKGHSVSVLWRGGEVDSISGFDSEHDALEWIKEIHRVVAGK